MCHYGFQTLVQYHDVDHRLFKMIIILLENRFNNSNDTCSNAFILFPMIVDTNLLIHHYF